MNEQTKPISQREVRKGENWILYLRANKKVKEKIYFKSFIRKKNLGWSQTGPCRALSVTREKQNHRRSGRDSFKLKAQKLGCLFRLAKPSCKFLRNNPGLGYFNSSFQVLTTRTKAKKILQAWWRKTDIKGKKSSV